MSYCRFQNTLRDLRACQTAMEDGDQELSPEEARARRELIKLCRVIGEDHPHEE
jgi:hypothetical protein